MPCPGNKQIVSIMKIAVTGGKGGTGKSTIATALAAWLSKKSRVLLLDLDVDCPNDHLILSAKLRKVSDVKSMIPDFDLKKCIKCGRCRKACMENAIVQVKGRYPFVVPEQCTGCRACKIVCPVNAITEKEQVIGHIFRGRGATDLITGTLKPGIEESSLVVNAAKRYAEKYESSYDYVIIDTAAGTHCPVISALLGADVAIAVTEPTPLGSHDLDLILDLTGKLGIKAHVVINRSDIAGRDDIEKTARKHKANIIAEIPYSMRIIKNYSEGRPITHKAIRKIADVLA